MAFTECDEYLKMISEPSSFWEWKTLHHRTSGRRPIRKQPRWWRHPSVFKSFAAKKSLHLTAWLDLKKLGHRSQEKSLKSMEYTRWAWSQFIDYVQSAPICSLDGHKFGIWLKRFHWPSCSRLPQSLDRKFWMMKFYWFVRGFQRNWPQKTDVFRNFEENITSRRLFHWTVFHASDMAPLFSRNASWIFIASGHLWDTSRQSTHSAIHQPWIFRVESSTLDWSCQSSSNLLSFILIWGRDSSYWHT